MNLLGIELGVDKVAVSLCQDDQLMGCEAYLSPSDHHRAAQLRELGSVVQAMALAVDANAVWIEDTIIGNNRKYSIGLAEAKGAGMAACASLPLDIRLVDNKVWKRDVVGNGNADKTAPLA